MKKIKLIPSLKGLAKEMMPTGGIILLPLPPGKFIGNFGNPLATFKIPYSCSHIMRRTINSFILQTWILHALKLHPSELFFRATEQLHRSLDGRYEWMAWMEFAHETTTSLHNTSTTWHSHHCNKNTRAFHAKFMADSKFKATLNYDEFVYVPPYQDAKLLLFLFLSDGI